MQLKKNKPIICLQYSRQKASTAPWADFSTVQFHCASGGFQAYFGGGTRLTVLGKKSSLNSLKYCIRLYQDFKYQI